MVLSEVSDKYKALLSFISVSYTHLDVYKRQPYFSATAFNFARMLHRVLRVPVGIISVSYTHLDVYKRQNLSHARKVMLNDVEIALSEVYATAHAVYFPIPRTIPCLLYTSRCV